MKTLIFALTMIMASSIGVADPTLLMTGALEVKPTSVPNHPNPVKVALELYFDQANLTNVKATTDLPVMGKTSFDSKEQAFFTLKRPGFADQVSAAWKFKNVPHAWYFVVVANAQASGKDFVGTVYKVKLNADQIKDLLSKGIDLTTGKEPADWKNVGTATLSAK